MKTWKHIFQEVIEPQNMRCAVRLALRGKRGLPAAHRAVIDPDGYAEAVRAKVASGEWTPPKHKRCRINDGIRKKEREIVKPQFAEQVVHHAVIMAMEPMLMRGMYEYSCGSIPGRGASYGKRYLERYIRNNPKKCRYVLKMDIRHFFQSIDQETLMGMFSRIIRGRKIRPTQPSTTNSTG